MDEPTESLTPTELRLRLTDDWHPRTERQRAAAIALATRRRGALVRQRADGTTEVLTGSNGEFTRYVVAADGSEAVLEAIPSDGSYWTAWILGLLGLTLFAAGLWLVAGDNARVREWSGAASFIGGFLLMILGFGAVAGEDGEHGALLHTNPGERWTSVGYPEPD